MKKHKCNYFHFVDGELVCVQCGAPSKRLHEVIEDKAMKSHEDKNGDNTDIRTSD